MVAALGDVAGKALLKPVVIVAGRQLSNRLFDWVWDSMDNGS